jgi:hypothetical protein
MANIVGLTGSAVCKDDYGEQTTYVKYVDVIVCTCYVTIATRCNCNLVTIVIMHADQRQAEHSRHANYTGTWGPCGP